MSTFKIGMVGMGFIADWHHRGFSAQPGVEFAGLTQDLHGTPEQISSKRQQLRAKGQALKTKVYENFEQMVDDPTIDALIIGSINPYHIHQIRRGLAAGKHLLVEKPVVTDIAQVAEIERLSVQNSRVLFPGHNFVYRGAVRQARELIEAGALGRRVAASFVVSHTISPEHAAGWRSKRATGTGGTLIDSGHHLVYQSLYLLGMPVALSAFTSRQVLTQMECEDTAQVSLQYADGSVATIMQSWAAGNGGMNGIRLLGDKGCIQITDALYLNGERLNDDTDYGASFVNQAKAFMEAVRGGAGPVSTLTDVRNTLRITFGAYESAEKRVVLSL